jgi:hypothetical protein
MENRYFYHSFPRIRVGEDGECVLDKSLATLETISKVGLILAPEVVEWRIPLVDETTKQVKYRQTRVCFTELARAVLPNRARKFGPTALEFPLEVLRQSGALPVIYMPQMVRDDRHLSSVGAMLVWVLSMVRYTLEIVRPTRGA